MQSCLKHWPYPLKFKQLHVLCSGDFYQASDANERMNLFVMSTSNDCFSQLPPPADSSLFKRVDMINGSEVDKKGKTLWLLFKQFWELKTNHRWLADGGLVSQICPLAREGLPVEDKLIDELNRHCIPTAGISYAAKRADPKALWIAATKVSVEEINSAKFKQLISDGAVSVRVWAKHRKAVSSGVSQIMPTLAENLVLMSMKPLNDKWLNGLGIGRNYLDLCMGMRLRVNRNQSICDGLYQGAMGTGKLPLILLCAQL